MGYGHESCKCRRVGGGVGEVVAFTRIGVEIEEHGRAVIAENQLEVLAQ